MLYRYKICKIFLYYIMANKITSSSLMSYQLRPRHPLAPPLKSVFQVSDLDLDSSCHQHLGM